MKIILKNTSLKFETFEQVPVNIVELGTYTSVSTTAVNKLTGLMDGKKGLFRIRTSDSDDTSSQLYDSKNLSAKGLWTPLDLTGVSNSKIYIIPHSVGEIFTLEYIATNDYILPVWYVKQNVTSGINVNTNTGYLAISGSAMVTDFIAGTKKVTFADSLKGTQINISKYSSTGVYVVGGGVQVMIPDTGVVDLSDYNASLVRIRIATTVSNPIVSIL